ncbi:hypothetical protein [Pseudomonas veronii]
MPKFENSKKMDAFSQGLKMTEKKAKPKQPTELELIQSPSAPRKKTKPRALALVHATHKGSFEADFGLDVECYVLGDEKKTAVISQRGMALRQHLGQLLGIARVSQSKEQYEDFVQKLFGDQQDLFK